MKCPECGTETKSTQCPDCGFIVNSQKKNKKPATVTTKKEKLFKIVGVIIYVLGLLICLGASATSEASNLPTAAGAIVAAGIIAHFALFKKAKIKVAIGVIITYVCLMVNIVLCSHGIPEAIRAIKGAEFVSPYAGYAVGLNVAAFVICFIVKNIIVNSGCKNLRAEDFTDADLMSLNNRNKYHVTAYYLAKAKFNGIITYHVVPATEESAAKCLIHINKNITEEQLADYCVKFPVVKKIVEYIKNSADPQNITVRDILANVRVEYQILSKGAQQIKSIQDKVKKIVTSIAVCFEIAILYPGITKLFMGIHYGKDVNNLVYVLIVLTVIPMVILTTLADGRINKKLKPISDQYAGLYRSSGISYADSVSAHERLNNNEINILLKAFAVNSCDNLTTTGKMTEADHAGQNTLHFEIKKNNYRA